MIAAWLWLTTTAWAERPITYREALSAALEANPALQRARLDREAAAAGLIGANGEFDPIFGIDGNWRRAQSQDFLQGTPFSSRSRIWNLGTSLTGTAPTGSSFSLDASLNRNFSSFTSDRGTSEQDAIQDAYTSNVSVSITQNLLRGLRLSFNLQNITRARQGLTTAELSLERSRQQTLSQTAQAYWTWAYQSELVRIAEEGVTNAEEALRVGSLRVEAGELAPLEQTRLEAALVQAQTNALEAHNTEEQSADSLALLMGSAPGQDWIAATTAGDVPPIELDGPAAIEVALAQNLDLAIARADLTAAELDAVNARHARLPTLAATGSTGIGAQDTSASSALSGLLDEDAFPFISIGGRFSVPLGNRAARGEAERLSATERQRRFNVTELESSVTAEVQQQVRLLSAAARRVELADANVRLAQQTLTAEEALVEAGRRIQRDVLDARTELERTQIEAARARTDYRLAQVELLRLQGQLTAAPP